jgi:hypothetical protein
MPTSFYLAISYGIWIFVWISLLNLTYRELQTFFSGRYARYNESGDLVTPAPWKIAPQALEDSCIPMIEQSVLQTVVQNSGWNLLSDV